MILVRNTEWAASFFADVGQYAYMHQDTIEKHMRPVRTNHDLCACAAINSSDHGYTISVTSVCKPATAYLVSHSRVAHKALCR